MKNGLSATGHRTWTAARTRSPCRALAQRMTSLSRRQHQDSFTEAGAGGHGDLQQAGVRRRAVGPALHSEVDSPDPQFVAENGATMWPYTDIGSDPEYLAMCARDLAIGPRRVSVRLPDRMVPGKHAEDDDRPGAGTGSRFTAVPSFRGASTSATTGTGLAEFHPWRLPAGASEMADSLADRGTRAVLILGLTRVTRPAPPTGRQPRSRPACASGAASPGSGSPP